MQCTLCCCLYLSHASSSALLSLSSHSSLLCGFLPSALPSSSHSLSPSLIPSLNSLCFLPLSPTMPYFHASTGVWRQRRHRAYWYSSLSSYLCLSPSLTLTHTHTKHLSMEIEIMIMYPSVCIKVLPLQKMPAGMKCKREADGLRRRKEKGSMCEGVCVCVSFSPLPSCLYFVHWL